MSQGDWKVVQGDALTRFLFSAAKTERFAEFYTGEGADPATSESFCRDVFRQNLAQRAVDPAAALTCNEAVIADERGVVSFPDFRPLPFHIQRWLAIDLYAPSTGTFAFHLGTCGGVRVWCEGAQVACFTPFTRNLMQHTDVEIPLCAGKNSLLIHLDELAERELNCSLQMVYLGAEALSAAFPHTQVLAEHQCASQYPVASHTNVCASHLLTLMQQREYEPQAEALLYSALKHISAREEASVFSVLPLLQIWRCHQGEYFSEVLFRRIKSTLMGYRYWRDERGCDAMRFDTENHALAFHAAQYLAGQSFPDALFIASCRKGREQQAIAKARLENWLSVVEAKGLAELNAIVSYPVDYRGLSALALMADDASLRDRAARLMKGVQA